MRRGLKVGRRQFLKTGAGLAALAAFPLGLAPAALAEEPVKGGTLKLGFSADPAGFDPARGPSGMSHVVIEQVYSTLMSVDPDAQPYPDLAEKFEQSADGLEYTFHLRKGVKFHDGSDLTAEDVKFTFDRLRAKDSGYSYGSQVETISEVVVVDPHTVTFKLSKPTGPFLVYMAFPGSSIVPKKLVESGHDLNSKPVGSGPFKFVSYEPRSMVKFTRNEAFYETGKPYFDALEFHLIADITALTNAVISGTINFSNEIPPKDWQTVTATPGLVGTTLEGSRYYWLLMNNTVAPLDNPKVRQAIAHAIDRSAIVTGVFFGQAVPFKGGVIPEWNWGYAGIDYFAAGADPEKAKALLKEAGHADGFTTSLTMASSFPAMIAMAPIIQANLAAVGIKAEIKTMEIPRYWDEVWGPVQVRPDRHVLGVAARRSRRLRHQQLCLRHGDQCAEELQQGDGRGLGQGQIGTDTGGPQGGLCRAAETGARGNADRASGKFLHPDRLYGQAQELQADAHRLPENVEGRLARSVRGYAFGDLLSLTRERRNPCAAREE